MRNFQDTFETRKRSFISTFSICMTVPFKQAQLLFCGEFRIAELIYCQALFVTLERNLQKIIKSKNEKYFCFRASSRVRLFSMMRPGYVIYDVYLHYSSDI